MNLGNFNVSPSPDAKLYFVDGFACNLQAGSYHNTFMRKSTMNPSVRFDDQTSIHAVHENWTTNDLSNAWYTNEEVNAMTTDGMLHNDESRRWSESKNCKEKTCGHCNIPCCSMAFQ